MSGARCGIGRSSIRRATLDRLNGLVGAATEGSGVGIGGQVPLEAAGELGM